MTDGMKRTLLEQAMDAVEDLASAYIWEYGTDEDRKIQDMIYMIADKIDEIDG